jgi:hypothetical protein
MDRLPKDLEETYHQYLKCIAPANSRALRVLKWVCYASRPLRIEELREAIAFDLDNEKWDHERIPTREFVVGCCANLVIEDPVDGLVRFAHPSVGQYLERNECPLGPWPKSPEHGRLECGEYCVAYLLFSDFSLQLERKSFYQRSLEVPNLGCLAREATKSSTIGRLFSWRLGKKQVEPANMPLIIRTKSTLQGDKYNFLGYATMNWASQTKTIPINSPVWTRFGELALTFNETWNFQPWMPGGRSLSSHIHALFGWAVQE